MPPHGWHSSRFFTAWRFHANLTQQPKVDSWIVWVKDSSLLSLELFNELYLFCLACRPPEGGG